MRSGGGPEVEKSAPNLYRADSIERAMAAGKKDVDAAPPVIDREAGQGRVARWAREAVGEANARTGDVPPIWRDIERRIERSFRPPRNAVTRASSGGILARQLLSTGTAKIEPTLVDKQAPERSREATLAADVAAGQAAAARAQGWVRTEILVEVGPDGLLRSAEIAASSGRAALDKLALEAVRAAVAEHPIAAGCRRAPPCTVRVRWAVEAAVRVHPPPVMVPTDPRTGGPAGLTPLGLKFSFDEASGKIQHERAFQSEVCTRVTLLSIE